jgi:hypothetical protein
MAKDTQTKQPATAAEAARKTPPVNLRVPGSLRAGLIAALPSEEHVLWWQSGGQGKVVAEAISFDDLKLLRTLIEDKAL